MGADPDSLAVEFQETAAGWDRWPGREAAITAALRAAVRVGGLTHRPGAEVCVVLSDDAGVRDLNGRWRGRDAPTNVLSFPAATADRIPESWVLGDVVLARETCERESVEEGAAFSDHVLHLCVHGFLHLFGYDHGDDDDARRMEQLESRILAGLGISDPYALRSGEAPRGDPDPSAPAAHPAPQAEPRHA